MKNSLQVQEDNKREGLLELARTCKDCNAVLPFKTTIDFNQTIYFKKRNYCLSCLPYKRITTNPVTLCYYCNNHCGTRQKICSKCESTIRRYKVKIKSIEYKGGKCTACNYAKHPRSLQFHHKDRKEKEMSFNKIHQISWEVLKQELDKCDLVCGNCHNEIEEKYTLNTKKNRTLSKRALRVQKRKQVLLDIKNNSCQCCGYNKCSRSLSFHHRNPEEKSFDISNKIENSWDEVLSEVNKCDLVCINCHFEIEDELSVISYKRFLNDDLKYGQFKDGLKGSTNLSKDFKRKTWKDYKSSSKAPKQGAKK